jgi:hypothetical protein
MTPSAFENIFNKVKTVTKQAADTTAKQAKIAKFRMNLMTLQTEKSRLLQTIGARVHYMYSEKKALDAGELIEQIKDELGNIERIDIRVQEIEQQIAELQAKDANIEVTDVTGSADTQAQTATPESEAGEKKSADEKNQ